MCLNTLYLFVICVLIQNSLGEVYGEIPTLLETDLHEAEFTNGTGTKSAPIEGEKPCDEAVTLQTTLGIMISMLRQDLSAEAKTTYLLETMKRLIKNTAYNEVVTDKINDLLHTLDMYKKTDEDYQKSLRSGLDNLNLNVLVRKSTQPNQKIQLKYELPTLTNSWCTEALLNIVKIAYQAYVSLAKNPICNLPGIPDFPTDTPDIDPGMSESEPIPNHKPQHGLSNLNPMTKLPSFLDSIFPTHPSNAYPTFPSFDHSTHPERLPVQYKPVYDYLNANDGPMDDSGLLNDESEDPFDDLTPSQYKKSHYGKLNSNQPRQLHQLTSKHLHSPSPYGLYKPEDPLGKFNPYQPKSYDGLSPNHPIKPHQLTLNHIHPYESKSPLDDLSPKQPRQYHLTAIPLNSPYVSEDPFEDLNPKQPNPIPYGDLSPNQPRPPQKLPSKHFYSPSPYRSEDPYGDLISNQPKSSPNDGLSPNQSREPHQLKPLHLPYGPQHPLNSFTLNLPRTQHSTSKHLNFPYGSDVSNYDLTPDYNNYKLPYKSPSNPNDDAWDQASFPYFRPKQDNPFNFPHKPFPAEKLLQESPHSNFKHLNPNPEHDGFTLNEPENPYSNPNHLYPNSEHDDPFDFAPNKPGNPYSNPNNLNPNPVRNLQNPGLFPWMKSPSHLHSPNGKPMHNPAPYPLGNTKFPLTDLQNPDQDAYEELPRKNIPKTLLPNSLNSPNTFPFYKNPEVLNPDELDSKSVFPQFPKPILYKPGSETPESAFESPYQSHPLETKKTSPSPFISLVKNPDDPYPDSNNPEFYDIQLNPNMHGPHTSPSPKNRPQQFGFQPNELNPYAPAYPDFPVPNQSNQDPGFELKLDHNRVPVLPNINSPYNWNSERPEGDNPFFRNPVMTTNSPQSTPLKELGFIEEAIEVIEGVIPAVMFDPPTLYIIAKIKDILVHKGKDIELDEYRKVLEMYEKLINYVKQLNAYKQIIDLIDLPSVTNSPKLETKKVVELTYLVKRPQPVVYYPYYYVKYRLPYQRFIHAAQNLLYQKPELRTNPNELYEELLTLSRVVETSPDLKSYEKKDLLGLIFKSGSLVNAKLIRENSTLTGHMEALKEITSDLTADEIMGHNEEASNQIKLLDTVNHHQTNYEQNLLKSIKSNAKQISPPNKTLLKRNEMLENDKPKKAKIFLTPKPSLGFTSFDSHKLRNNILRGQHPGLSFADPDDPRHPERRPIAPAMQKLLEATYKVSNLREGSQQNIMNSEGLLNTDNENISLNTGIANHQHSIRISNPKVVMNNAASVSNVNSDKARAKEELFNQMNLFHTSNKEINQQSLANQQNVWSNQQNYYNSGGLVNFDNQKVSLNSGAGNNQENIDFINSKYILNHPAGSFFDALLSKTPKESSINNETKKTVLSNPDEVTETTKTSYDNSFKRPTESNKNTTNNNIIHFDNAGAKTPIQKGIINYGNPDNKVLQTSTVRSSEDLKNLPDPGKPTEAEIANFIKNSVKEDIHQLDNADDVNKGNTGTADDNLKNNDNVATSSTPTKQDATTKRPENSNTKKPVSLYDNEWFQKYKYENPGLGNYLYAGMAGQQNSGLGKQNIGSIDNGKWQQGAPYQQNNLQPWYNLEHVRQQQIRTPESSGQQATPNQQNYPQPGSNPGVYGQQTMPSPQKEAIPGAPGQQTTLNQQNYSQPRPNPGSLGQQETQNQHTIHQQGINYGLYGFQVIPSPPVGVNSKPFGQQPSPNPQFLSQSESNLGVNGQQGIHSQQIWTNPGSSSQQITANQHNIQQQGLNFGLYGYKVIPNQPIGVSPVSFDQQATSNQPFFSPLGPSFGVNGQQAMPSQQITSNSRSPGHQIIQNPQNSPKSKIDLRLPNQQAPPNQHNFSQSGSYGQHPMSSQQMKTNSGSSDQATSNQQPASNQQSYQPFGTTLELSDQLTLPSQHNIPQFWANLKPDQRVETQGTNPGPSGSQESVSQQNIAIYPARGSQQAMGQENIAFYGTSDLISQKTIAANRKPADQEAKESQRNIALYETTGLSDKQAKATIPGTETQQETGGQKNIAIYGTGLSFEKQNAQFGTKTKGYVLPFMSIVYKQPVSMMVSVPTITRFTRPAPLTYLG